MLELLKKRFCLLFFLVCLWGATTVQAATVITIDYSPQMYFRDFGEPESWYYGGAFLNGVDSLTIHLDDDLLSDVPCSLWVNNIISGAYITDLTGAIIDVTHWAYMSVSDMNIPGTNSLIFIRLFDEIRNESGAQTRERGDYLFLTYELGAFPGQDDVCDVSALDWQSYTNALSFSEDVEENGFLYQTYQDVEITIIPEPAICLYLGLSGFLVMWRRR